MNTSDFITWLSVLVAILAFANPYHRLKVKSLNFVSKFLFLGLGFAILFFSTIYPKNLFNFSYTITSFLKEYTFNLFCKQYVFNIILELKNFNLTSEVIALFLAIIFTVLIIYSIFFNKQLSLHSASDIDLLDELYNQGEKGFADLASILEKNTSRLVKIVNIEKKAKLWEEFTFVKTNIPIDSITEDKNTFKKIKINPYKFNIQQANLTFKDRIVQIWNIVRNKTWIPFLNLKNSSYLKIHDKLESVMSVILTDEKFVNFLIRRNVGVNLFLDFYQSINSDYSENKGKPALKYVQSFVNLSLRCTDSKLYIFLNKEIETNLTNSIFSDPKRILNSKLLFLIFDWLVEDFEEKSGEPKIEADLFIENLGIKFDLLLKFIKKFGIIAKKEKTMTDVYDLNFSLSDKFLKYLIDYDRKNACSFLDGNILYGIEELLNNDVLVVDGDDSESHGLLYLYVNLSMRISKIEGSNKYMHNFLDFCSQGGIYTDEMHKHWDLIKTILSSNNHYFTSSEKQKMKNCLNDSSSNPKYLFRVNGSVRKQKIEDFTNEIC